MAVFLFALGKESTFLFFGVSYFSWPVPIGLSRGVWECAETRSIGAIFDQRTLASYGDAAKGRCSPVYGAHIDASRGMPALDVSANSSLEPGAFLTRNAHREKTSEKLY